VSFESYPRFHKVYARLKKKGNKTLVQERLQLCPRDLKTQSVDRW
jgi:hypothetical protein